MLRWAERLASDTTERRAMLEGYALVQQRLHTDVPPGETGAGILLDVFNARRQQG